MSFCDFEFIKKNFLFLKTTTGRGLFDVFCSGLFLVTSNGVSIWNWVMAGVLGVCGIFFVVMGMLGKNPAGEDYK